MRGRHHIMTWDFAPITCHTHPCRSYTNEEDARVMFTPSKPCPSEAALRNETQTHLKLLLSIPWELLRLLMP